MIVPEFRGWPEKLAAFCLFVGILGTAAAIIFGGVELVRHIRWK